MNILWAILIFLGAIGLIISNATLLKQLDKYQQRRQQQKPSNTDTDATAPSDITENKSADEDNRR